jgi:protein-S-isoprenylcysteine O-methyltransferase Ste14
MPWRLDWPTHPYGQLLLIASLVTGLCVALVLAAVLRNFLLAGGEVRHQRRSPVATGIMLLFAAVIYIIIKLHLGVVPLYPIYYVLSIAIGLLLMVGGTVVNLWGRAALGRNWANQVTVYQDQTLVTTGPYRLVRHPLYASTIWMLYGACLIYRNWAATLAVTLIFLPMMIYRARQEEEALAQQFPDYAAYQRRVGRLLPKIAKGDPHAHQ